MHLCQLLLSIDGHGTQKTAYAFQVHYVLRPHQQDGDSILTGRMDIEFHVQPLITH